MFTLLHTPPSLTRVKANAKVLFSEHDKLEDDVREGDSLPTDCLQILTTRSHARHYIAILVISQSPTSPRDSLGPLGWKIASTNLAYITAEDALLGLLDIVSEGLDRKAKGPVEADVDTYGEVMQLVARCDAGWYAVTSAELAPDSDEEIERRAIGARHRKMSNR